MKNKILSLLFFTAVTISAFAQDIKITEAKLGTDVQDRNLAGESSTFSKDSKVYFWIKTSGGTGSITVTWKHGSNSRNTSLNIGGSPWRTWAYATASASGEWTVTATDDKGTVLKEMKFTVQ